MNSVRYGKFRLIVWHDSAGLPFLLLCGFNFLFHSNHIEFLNVTVIRGMNIRSKCGILRT